MSYPEAVLLPIGGIITPLQHQNRGESGHIRIEKEDVKFGFLCGELFGSRCARRKVSKVEPEEVYVILASDLLQFFDCRESLALVSGGEIDFRIMFEECLVKLARV